MFKAAIKPIPKFKKELIPAQICRIKTGKSSAKLYETLQISKSKLTFHYLRSKIYMIVYGALYEHGEFSQKPHCALGKGEYK